MLFQCQPYRFNNAWGDHFNAIVVFAYRSEIPFLIRFENYSLIVQLYIDFIRITHLHQTCRKYHFLSLVLNRQFE